MQQLADFIDDMTMGASMMVDTRDNILAVTPASGLFAFATDTKRFYVSDGTSWLQIVPNGAVADSQAPDMGAEPDSARTGYGDTYLVNKSINACTIGANGVAINGGVKVTTAGEFYFYSAATGTWQKLVANFVLCEDAAFNYTLEHAPVGFLNYIEIMTGQSLNNLGLNGLPLTNGYRDLNGSISISNGDWWKEHHLMTTYYLNADTGVDTGAGGSGAPWKTLVYAVAHSTTGDTLYCQNATATYDFRNTTITSRTITGKSVTGVVFDGGSGNYYWAINTGITILRNITIQNIINTGGPTIYAPCYGTGIVFTMDRCIWKSCITSGGSSTGGIVGNQGWELSSGVITISSCIFDDIRTAADGLVGAFGFRGAQPGVTFLFNNNVWITRTAANQHTSIFGGYDNWFTIIAKNNIFRNLQSTIYFFATSYGHSTHVTLALTNCDYSGTWSDGEGTVVKTNCITADPLFVDENNGDFHLLPASPCIDTGTLI